MTNVRLPVVGAKPRAHKAGYISTVLEAAVGKSAAFLEKLTSTSSTAGRLLSVDSSVSGNPISSFMGEKSVS